MLSTDTRNLLLGLQHQLSTDADLDERVTAPEKYDALEARVRELLEKHPERIDPIDVDVWEPNPDTPGYLRVASRLTVDQLRQELNRRLKDLGMEPDEYGFNTTLARYENWLHEPVPKFRRICCFAVTGTSEGHYIHVDLIAESRAGINLCRCGHSITCHERRDFSDARKFVKSPCYGTSTACECKGYVPAEYNASLHIPLFLAKTFQGMERACEIAATCSALLS